MREAIAEQLGLEFEENAEIANAIRHRLTSRGWKLTDRILRQALVPRGATILPNDCGTAPGLYFPKNPATASPHIFALLGPPRELHPMFVESVLPILRDIASDKAPHEFRTYRIAGIGESLVEEAVGTRIPRYQESSWDIARDQVKSTCGSLATRSPSRELTRFSAVEC